MKQLKRLIIRILSILLIFTILGQISAKTDENFIKVIDSFDRMENWKKITGGLSVGAEKGVKGNCIRFDYDLDESREWVVISRNVKGLVLPDDYKITFFIKGEGLKNNLEFKLVNEKGDVFWKKWEDFKLTDKWEKIVLKKRDIVYGWGSGPNAKLLKINKIELGISKGLGGKGSVFIDELTLIPDTKVIQVKASSVQDLESSPKNAYDGNKDTRWSSKFSDPQWLEIDFGGIKELVGMTLYWEDAYGKSYNIFLSKDGKEWVEVYDTKNGGGNTDDIDFKPAKARYVKINGRERGSYWGYSLFEVVMKTTSEPWGEGEVPGIISKPVWEFMPDPQNTGERDRWYSPENKSEGWAEIKACRDWESQGFADYDGDAWYKAMFYIPESWNDGDPMILLTGVRDEYKLYINGEPVFEYKGKHGKKNTINIKKYIKANSQNLFAVKVSNLSGRGGITGSVFIIKNERALTNKILKLKQESFKKYYQFLAYLEPEGYFPYWLHEKQGFWTVVGMDRDYRESLFLEDGTIEPYKSFSIAPFLYLDDELITREDAALSQSLRKGYLPLPSVTWKYKGIQMDIEAVPYGKEGETLTYARYKIKNRSKGAVQGKLFLAVRPFEINPPWQWGGFNNIKDIKREDNFIRVNEFKIALLSKPSNFGVCGYTETDIMYAIEKGAVPDKTDIIDKSGLAAGAIEYEYNLKPGEEASFFLAIPLHKEASVVDSSTGPGNIETEFKRMIGENIEFWEQKLNNVEINIPDSDIINTFRANLAYIFINKDGPAIQPGSRAYEASWIRDGAMTSSALLRTGYYREAKEYIDWYCKYMYKDGRVPAIVIIGRDEINPVKEYDSQGELIYAILQYYYFTGDTDFLKEKWPFVLKSLKHLEYLRDQRITDKYIRSSGDERRYYGILPNSVSHEGYYPEPGNHSYWDDFWALKGWKDAGVIAGIIGEDDCTEWIKREEKELRENVYKSIDITMRCKNINYIPGCAELGDFDATSTAIAIMVCDELENLPQPQLKNTFDRYYNDLLKRMEHGWEGSFTPYEIRSLQAYLYMGEKDRALTLLHYLLGCRWPAGWRHWAEAVYFPPRKGGYIGDMPHTWVGSGFINSIRSMFVYEQGKKLVLGAGIDERWFDKQDEIYIKGFPTQFGSISYTVNKTGNVIKVEVSGKAKPDEGFIFKPPFLKRNIMEVKVNGKKREKFSDNEVVFDKLPVEIEISY